jgi:gluconate 2-dehydrogenase gamma chain
MGSRRAAVPERPWQPGTPSQGYPLPFTPAELFRTAIAATNGELKATPFSKMSAEQQDAYLTALETGGKDFGGVPSNTFFSMLWESTLEGFFSDPVYGGNRNMVAWRMLGFPGADASYFQVVDQHGIHVDRADEPCRRCQRARPFEPGDPGAAAVSRGGDAWQNVSSP